MNWVESTILGLVQGLTEFLPVSSSGHLVMAETLMDVPNPGVFVEVTLHVATLLSVVVVYRRRLLGLVMGAVRMERDAWQYVGLLVLATIPAAVVGLFFEDAIVGLFDRPAVTGVMLIVTGGFLWSTRYVQQDQSRTLESVRNRPTWALALVMGIAQSFAILPGISRSGSTITAGLWGRVAGERAAEFSFLMSIPAIAGAAVLQLDELGESVATVGGGALLAGFVASLISGVAAIVGLVWLLRRQEFYKFSYYLWIAGGLFLIYLSARG